VRDFALSWRDIILVGARIVPDRKATARSTARSMSTKARKKSKRKRALWAVVAQLTVIDLVFRSISISTLPSAWWTSWR